MNNPFVDDLARDILALKASKNERSRDLEYLLSYYSGILDSLIIDAYEAGHHCGRNVVIQANN